jgi:transcription termination/antitermination protein NusA
MIPGERFRVHDRVRALLAEVKDSPRGPQIILSRTHRNFLRRLLENEVPEIYHGIVEIRSIAREPGERAKVAVFATQQGIDPVGACVGIRGVRIQAIVRELHDEKIDVIEWNPDPALYIAKALSPARVLGVYLNEKNNGGKTATVVVPEDQLSLAIGRDGQNARLAAKLTGWRIDIKSLPEATSDVFFRVQSDPAYAFINETETALVETIQGLLAKKAENRPLTPEEYDRMAKFVDQTEKKVAAKRQPEKKVEDTTHQELRKQIPAAAFEQNILDSGLTEHVAYTLQGHGISTTGELALQMKLDEDAILRMQGIGPRAMQDIQRLVNSLIVTAPAEEEAAAAADEQPTAEAELPAAVVETTIETEQEEAEAVEEPAEVETALEVPAQAELTPVDAEEQETEEKEEGEEATFDQLFTLRPEVIEGEAEGEEEEDDSTGKGGKKKSKKKGRRHVEIEYDPEADRTFVTKKHKRGDEWEWS